MSLAKLERSAGGPMVLLFYDGFERKALPGLKGRITSDAHRAARFLYRTARRKQVHTGFYTAFLSLQRSLVQLGCDVRVNDFAAARARPNYPIGIAGYPEAIERVNLTNPVIFGHGDLGLPERASVVAARPNMRILIQPCDWACEFNRPYCGNKLRSWPVGVDTGEWALGEAEKTVDVLVYDKIRWMRDTLVPAVRDKLVRQLAEAGYRVEILEYGKHIRQAYRDALARSRALLFLCEHETQGIAYQEAMAAGIPVLAWDEGKLIDPVLAPYAPDLAVTSVPYFDERCGMRFTLADFDRVMPEFMGRIDSFDPRAYMKDRLSMQRAGEDYLALYASLFDVSHNT